MVHLHIRSCYSLLRSCFRVEEIVQAAKETGCRAAALCDLQVMHGTMQFWNLCRNAGIHPILGMEAWLQLDGEPLNTVLLARNDAGLQQLYALSYQYSTGRKIPVEEARDMLPDCYVILTGVSDVLDRAMQHNQPEQIRRILGTCRESFGDRLVCGLSMSDSAMRRELNVGLKQQALDLGIETCALSIVLYRHAEDVELLRVLRAVEAQTILTDQRLDVSYHRYFRSAREMEQLYDPEDLEKTDEIAANCQVQMAFRKSGLPVFRNRLGLDSETYLIRLCRTGLKKRLPQGVPAVYRQRLEYELQVITSMGFTDYFLIVWDFIRFARSQNILVGPGRGSAAGSIVAWCLGITHIDPVKNHLLFERFLNPDRVSLPDIDTDVPDDRRDEVVRYLHDTYGHEHVAQIVTFSNMKARSVIRDIGRVMTIPVRTIDRLCKYIPQTPGANLENAWQQNPALRRMVEADERLRNLYAMARRLEGLPRHTSIHAAGVVLSDQPVDLVCPRMEMDGVCVTQFTMEYLEDLGLIKMDILSLRNLTIIAEVLTSIRNAGGPPIDINKISLNDPRVYALLQHADTAGVFQLESEGIRQLLVQMHPTCFEDISQIIALYRPGPMQNIQTFLERKNNPSRITYLHPLLEPILKDTYGVIVYQEQIMQIARDIGGFTLAQADLLRKAMSKKKKDVMESYHEAFLNGAAARGVDPRTASTIFSWMERFADYGFNKSHSYAYGLIVYQMAWLKTSYPLFFYQALLDSVTGSDSKSAQYIYECHRRNLRVLPVDIQLSADRYLIENGALRMPFQILKGIGRAVYGKVLEERKNGPYKDLYDCIARLLVCKVPESALRTLIDAGALDRFGYNRATLQKNLGRILEYCSLIRIDSQEVLFDYSIVSAPSIIKVRQNSMEQSTREYEVYGFYISEHPVASLRKRYGTQLPTIAQALNGNGYMKVLGRVASFRLHKTKRGDLMCFLNLEDETQCMDVVIMPDLLAMHRERIAKGRMVLVQGKKDRPASILARSLEWIEV